MLIMVSIELLVKKKKFDLKSLFGHFDTDGDGTVTREEFLQCMVELGIELNKFELNTIFWTLDPDKSGTFNIPRVF